MTRHDRQLGMGSPITRRDFLNGVAVGVGGAMAGWMSPDLETPAGARSAAAYPPALTGLRGSHPGSFEALHSMRDGAFWKTAPAPQATGEEYDLVVVGAGISGLAAAHFFRKARPDARILLLDNHDDFGGHAKRNEFAHNGRTYIGYGGTQSIDSPAPYSAVAKALIAELGIDVARYSKVLDSGLYKSLGLRSAFFFDKETFGADRLVVGDVRDEAFLAAAPLSDSVATRSQAAAHRAIRSDAGPELGREEGAAGANELHRLRDQAVEARSRRVAALPDAHARPLRRGRRRRAGAGRVRPRVPGLQRHGARSGTGPRAELRLDPPSGGRATTTSTFPTATPRSRGCSCAASCPARFPDRRWTTW